MKPRFEKIKLLYDNNYDELNRTRDWPLKIFSVIVAIYAGLMALLNAKSSSDFKFSPIIKYSGAILIALISVTVIYVMIRQHLRYLHYREIQRQLQKMLGIQKWSVGESKVFPPGYTKPIGITGIISYGWLSYVLILIVLTIIVVMTILQFPSQ